MAHRPALAEIRTRTYKQRDAWWTVWLVDPLASRLVWLVAPWPRVTPNLLTTFAFVVGLGSAAAFWRASYGWLLLGALLFHLSFVLDCMDGKIARLNGTGSVFGAWLDYVFDRLRVLACAVGLFGGQYARTHDFAYVWLAGLVIFLDMFRYLNALEMGKVKVMMKEQLAEATLTAGPALDTLGTAVDQVEEEEADLTPSYTGDDPQVDVHGDFRARFGLFVSIRNALLGQRIRPHLVSGIEFMMFVFIVGPVIAHIVATTLIVSLFFVAFELLLIYKLWTTTKTFSRRLAHLRSSTADDAANGTADAPVTAGA
jgi:phosphatidylglycerophosphate synthase